MDKLVSVGKVLWFLAKVWLVVVFVLNVFVLVYAHIVWPIIERIKSAKPQDPNIDAVGNPTAQ